MMVGKSEYDRPVAPGPTGEEGVAGEDGAQSGRVQADGSRRVPGGVQHVPFGVGDLDAPVVGQVTVGVAVRVGVFPEQRVVEVDEDTELLVSELIGSVVRHAGGPIRLAPPAQPLSDLRGLRRQHHAPRIRHASYTDIWTEQDLPHAHAPGNLCAQAFPRSRIARRATRDTATAGDWGSLR
jgi:hypothetical protein